MVERFIWFASTSLTATDWPRRKTNVGKTIPLRTTLVLFDDDPNIWQGVTIPALPAMTGEAGDRVASSFPCAEIL